MTPSRSRDDAVRPDALDRMIDEAIGSALGAVPVDLRERVMARLDEPTAASPARWGFALRPALVPAIGVALVVVAALLTWSRIDRAPARVAETRPASAAGRQAASAIPAPGPARGAAAQPAAEAPLSPAERRHVRAASAAVAATSGTLVAAASSSGPGAMDALATAGTGAAGSTPGPDDGAASLPGAPANDLGAPIVPLPAIRPITIQPIAAAPITEAPPVSTLAPSTDTPPMVGDLSRGSSGPGQTGGVRP